MTEDEALVATVLARCDAEAANPHGARQLSAHVRQHVLRRMPVAEAAQLLRLEINDVLAGGGAHPPRLPKDRLFDWALAHEGVDTWPVDAPGVDIPGVGHATLRPGRILILPLPEDGADHPEATAAQQATGDQSPDGPA